MGSRTDVIVHQTQLAGLETAEQKRVTVTDPIKHVKTGRRVDGCLHCITCLSCLSVHSFVIPDNQSGAAPTLHTGFPRQTACGCRLQGWSQSSACANGMSYASSPRTICQYELSEAPNTYTYLHEKDAKIYPKPSPSPFSNAAWLCSICIQGPAIVHLGHSV